MTSKQIHASLDKMLEKNNSKNFINHLVKSYMPISNVEKVFSEESKTEMKCVITGDELISVNDIVNILNSEETKENFMQLIKGTFTQTTDVDSNLKEMFGDKKLAVTGKNTNTYMSYDTLSAFYDWVFSKSLNGDKHINWLLHSVMPKNPFNRNTNRNSNFKQPKQNASTYTLGDASSVLAELKSKFNSK